MSQVCYFWKVCQLEATSWRHRTSILRNVQFSLVTQSCPTLCNSMDCSMPGLHIPHHLPNVAQDHVRCISDTIQPSQPPMPSSSPLNLSQHQGLSQRVNSSSGDQSIGASASASVLPMSIQCWFPLRLTGLISLLPEGLSEVFSSTIVWKWQFYGALPSLRSSSQKRAWPLGRP